MPWLQKFWPRRSARSLFAGLLVLAAFAVIAYLGQKVSTPEALAPCDSGGFPGRCYVSPQKACELNWVRAETECRNKVQKLNLPPTRLTSPIIQKCQFARLDQALTYSRVSTDECKRLHEELEAWRLRNPDLN